MKKKLLPLIILGTVIVTIGSQLLFIRLGGKGRFAEMPLIGDAFKIVRQNEEIVEVDSERYREVDEMVANLKSIIAEKDAIQKEQMQTNERLKNEIKRLHSNIKALDAELNRKLIFIDSHRAEGLKEMATMYESTDPAVVASIFAELKDEECAAILRFMRDRQAAKVIEAYTAMGTDDISRKDNAGRMADITKIMQKLVREEEEED